MDTLKGIYSVLKKSQHPELKENNLKNRNEKQIMFYQFCDILDKENVITDLQACMLLYGKEPCDTYRTLKKRTKQKLLDMLFSINLKEKDQFILHKRQFIECSRNMHAVKVLLMYNERAAAMDIAKSSLSSAIEYQQTDAVVFFAYQLQYNASLQGEKKDFAYYNNMHETHLEIQCDTFKAAKASQSFQMNFMRNRQLKPKHAPMAHEIANEIETLFNKHATVVLANKYFRLRAQVFQTEAKYKESNQVLEEWYQFLLKYKNLSWNSLFAEIFGNKMSNAIHLRDIESGENYALLAREYVEPGNHNWFTLKEIEFLMNMHSQKFIRAASIVDEVLSNKKFSKQMGFMKEKWQLYHAFSGFALAAFENENGTTFKNSIKKLSYFTHDKKGMYLNYLLIQALYSLINLDNDYILEKQDALKKYRSQYLKGPDNKRSNVFLNLLCSINADKFNCFSLNSSLKLAELHKTVFKFNPGDKEMQEIIPYEFLWKWITGQLVKMESIKAV